MSLSHCTDESTAGNLAGLVVRRTRLKDRDSVELLNQQP